MIWRPALDFIREEQASKAALPLRVSQSVRAGAETRPLYLLPVAAVDQGQEEAGLEELGFQESSLSSRNPVAVGIRPSSHCIWAISYFLSFPITCSIFYSWHPPWC